MNVRRLNTSADGFDAELTKLLHWDLVGDDGADGVEATVTDILARVRAHGDAAVLDCTRQFDRRTVENVAELALSADDLAAALARIPDSDAATLTAAANRIRTYHEHQVEASWSFTDEHGNELGQKITPLDRVGVYVPGGQASYPSSVLMTIVPAKVAGVREIVVTVPTPDDEVSDMVLAALSIAGADRVFTIGGAQAIAALAYGTQSIPRVDKIVGPGGAFVAAAKRQVFGLVGIDIIAGPSEVLVVADGSSDPEWTALDLFSQAEHDADAQAILVSPDSAFIDAVDAEMRRLLPTMARASLIQASLEGRGALIQARDLAEAVEIANRIAPEHLELHVAEPEPLLADIRHAGAIFVGAFAGETLGDYAAGPSHVLPTFGTARFGSPLGVYDFVKRSSVIRVSPQGAAELADVAVPLATSEGLEAHARAAAVRAGQTREP